MGSDLGNAQQTQCHSVKQATTGQSHHNIPSFKEKVVITPSMRLTTGTTQSRDLHPVSVHISFQNMEKSMTFPQTL